ncbi:hypothetical protein ACFW04_013238 [Cataglyphis niger]
MRRSISAPLVKSGVARPVRMPPRRSPNTTSPSFGGLGGTGRRTPERTPPMTSQGGPTTRSRAARASSVPVEKYATETGPLARTTARGVLRGPPTTGRKDQGAQPATTSHAGTAARDLLAALTPRSTPEGAVGPVRTPALQRGSPSPRMTPPTPTTIYGVVPGVTATPPLVPAASGSATLTTCTVTVTTCGGPVMSTGFLAGRGATPPSRSSPLPTIREVSPCEAYFEGLYSGGELLDTPDVEVERTQPPAEGEGFEYLLDPFTELEVDRRLRRMTNSAPGPDGITYRDLRGADPGVRLLTAFFNACLRYETVPASWKTSNTVLVYKKGDRGDIENWRPLALGDTTPKLFAALVADRLTDWTINNNILSPAQKGFLRDEGCFEHNFVLQEILTEARRTRREAVVAWLDLSNAFGSVPHAVIRRALVRSGVPGGIVNIWQSMYDGCTTRVRAADGLTAPIPVRSGVRQGCPLSPIIFDLAIDSVLRAVTDVDAGYDLLGSRVSILAYADDIALVADTPGGMQRLLAAAEEGASSVGLRFNPAKCATLHIGAGAGSGVLPTTFQIQGSPVRPLASGEPYHHLGIPTGCSVDQTPFTNIGGVLEDLGAVDRSVLAPWQKIEVVATNILPRLDFLLRGATVEKRPLKAADLEIRRKAKAWLNLPQRASAEVVYLPPKRGGCGLLPLADLADVLSVAHAYRMLTAGDETVRTLAWASLRGVVARRIGSPPNNGDLAAFLSGSLERRFRDGGERSLWSTARNAARRQSERLSLRWEWSEATEELMVVCRGPRGDAVKVTPGARNQVVTRLRSAVAAFYAGTLCVSQTRGRCLRCRRGRV